MVYLLRFLVGRLPLLITLLKPYASILSIIKASISQLEESVGEVWALFAEEESALICWLQEEEEGSLE